MTKQREANPLKMRRVDLTLTPSILDALREASRQSGDSMSRIVREALMAYLGVAMWGGKR